MVRAMRTIRGIGELKAAEGDELGTSHWHEVSQEAINAFANVTGDHQWIHVNPERARDTPLGGTIAHGYYTLSLGPALAAQVVTFEGFAFALNYGLDRVRFPSPMPVGRRVRATVRLAAVEEIPGGAQIRLEVTFEREGSDKPVCVAESLARLYVPPP
jgi:acyl dehydratase